MSTHLLIDFGSTYTKVMAVDIEKEVILGRAQAPTTIDTDISVGLHEALATLAKAKGLDKVQDFIARPIIPTPKATLQAATLLADGTRDEPGIGSLMIVEIGGATTNIHSVADQSPATTQTVLRGLPEQRVKRTVEGDLGIRYNAPTIFDLLGGDLFCDKLKALASGLDGDDAHAEAHIRHVSANVGHVPTSAFEHAVDLTLAETAASMAVERHAGTLRQEYSVVGEIMVQHGKNLLPVQNLIGTGGIFKYGTDPEKILRSVLFSTNKPWSLKPKSPAAYIDRDYMLYGIGLLADDFPARSLRIAKNYLKPTVLH